MIKNFLTINNDVDVQNAIGLFLNLDINTAEFNGFSFNITKTNVGHGFDNAVYDINILDCVGTPVIDACLPRKTYELLIQEEVREKIREFKDDDSAPFVFSEVLESINALEVPTAHAFVCGNYSDFSDY